MMVAHVGFTKTCCLKSFKPIDYYRTTKLIPQILHPAASRDTNNVCFDDLLKKNHNFRVIASSKNAISVQRSTCVPEINANSKLVGNVRNGVFIAVGPE